MDRVQCAEDCDVARSMANQLRLFMHGMSYVLMFGMRETLLSLYNQHVTLENPTKLGHGSHSGACLVCPGQIRHFSLPPPQRGGLIYFCMYPNFLV